MIDNDKCTLKKILLLNKDEASTLVLVLKSALSTSFQVLD